MSRSLQRTCISLAMVVAIAIGLWSINRSMSQRPQPTRAVVQRADAIGQILSEKTLPYLQQAKAVVLIELAADGDPAFRRQLDAFRKGLEVANVSIAATVTVGKNDPIVEARVIEQTLPEKTFRAALAACPPGGIIVSLAGIPAYSPALRKEWGNTEIKLVVPLPFRLSSDYPIWYRNGLLTMAILPKPDAPIDPAILEWPAATWFDRCRMVVDADEAKSYAW